MVRKQLSQSPRSSPGVNAPAAHPESSSRQAYRLPAPAGGPIPSADSAAVPVGPPSPAHRRPPPRLRRLPPPGSRAALRLAPLSPPCCFGRRFALVSPLHPPCIALTSFLHWSCIGSCIGVASVLHRSCICLAS